MIFVQLSLAHIDNIALFKNIISLESSLIRNASRYQ